MADTPRKIRLLIVSFTLPQVGGLETMVRLMAREFVRLADLEIRIVTPTPGDWDPGLPGVTVHRRPSLAELHAHHAWADAVFLNHFYLRLVVPLFWMPHKPVVLSISGYTPPDRMERWRQRLEGRLLLWLLHRANAVIACNQWCRSLLPVPSTIVRNPYDEERFFLHPVETERKGDLLFAGRIIHAKGCEELVEAFARLLGPHPGPDSPVLTMVGEGDLKVPLVQECARRGITPWVNFTGPMSGEAVAEEMRRHKVLVVPSRYEEPVGIVALEGLASGCVVVGSAGGGLAETVDRFGITFPNRDVAALATALREALAFTPEARALRLEGRERHLEPYRAATVAREYLKVVAGVLPGSLRRQFVTRLADAPV